MIFIDGFAIDAALTEEYGYDAEVTDYPVEQGANVSDNIRSRPLRITIDCVVSDTPLTSMEVIRSALAPAGAGGGGLPSDDGLTKMLAIRDAREPVTVITTLRRYENMALESLTIPRSKDTGDALRFRAVFKQIRFVTNARTTVRVATPKSRKRVNRGSKPAVPAGGTGGGSQIGVNESGLTQIRNWVGLGNHSLVPG